MGGPRRASSDAPVPLSRYANLCGPPSLIGEPKLYPVPDEHHRPVGPLRHRPSPPIGPGQPAAPAGQRAGPGAPGEDVLDGTFCALEYLAADAERLYAAAEKGGRA